MAIFKWTTQPKKIYLWSTEVKAVYKWTVKVRPEPTYTYSCDFRDNSKANLESEWWNFIENHTPNLSFDSNWCKVTKNSWQAYVLKTVDLSTAKSVHLEGTWFLKNNGGQWDWWLWLYIVPNLSPIDNPNCVSSRISRNISQMGLHLDFNNSGNWVQATMNEWEYSWELDLDLTTGAISWETSNSLSSTWTVNSTYLGYIKVATATLWPLLDWPNHYIHTFSATVTY